MIMNECIFCNIGKNKIIHEDPYWMSVYDDFPVNEGHVLIIPKRHINNVTELNGNEMAYFFSALLFVESFIKEKFKCDGFNIGINQGEAAGQTIEHLHIHVIPRYEGDIENPKGGIRGVIPEKRIY